MIAMLALTTLTGCDRDFLDVELRLVDQQLPAQEIPVNAEWTTAYTGEIPLLHTKPSLLNGWTARHTRDEWTATVRRDHDDTLVSFRIPKVAGGPSGFRLSTVQLHHGVDAGFAVRPDEGRPPASVERWEMCKYGSAYVSSTLCPTCTVTCLLVPAANGHATLKTNKRGASIIGLHPHATSLTMIIEP